MAFVTGTMKLQTIITVSFVLSGWFPGIAQQQPNFVLQSFEYIRNDDFPRGKYWLDIPEAGWIRDSIRKDFAAAIYRRWGLTMPEADLSTKPFGIFGGRLKFNTKLKDKKPNTWYMFLQVFSQNIRYHSFYNTTADLIVTLQLKCRIINGDNDSLVLDRDLTVDILTAPVSPGEVVLTKLPVHPVQFIQAFDSISSWLFDPVFEKSLRSLTLKPACALSGPEINDQPLAQLEFVNDDTSIHMVTQPLFSFKTPGPGYKKLTKKKNFGGNTATAAVTLITGVGINKSKVNDHSADFSFIENTDSLHCIVNYWESKIANRERTGDGFGGHSLQSGEYVVDQRNTDSTYINVITLNTDTIASFTIDYIASDERQHYTHLWDGTDSTTIMSIPKDWNNNSGTPNVLIKGTIEGNDFIMRSSRECTVKNFFVNNNIALSVYGKPLPVKALRFQQLSAMQIKLFTILASLPYSYFNYSAY